MRMLWLSRTEATLSNFLLISMFSLCFFFSLAGPADPPDSLPELEPGDPGPDTPGLTLSSAHLRPSPGLSALSVTVLASASNFLWLSCSPDRMKLWRCFASQPEPEPEPEPCG